MTEREMNSTLYEMKVELDDQDLRRHKRGIQMLGDIGSYCCNIVTEPELVNIRGNEITLAKQYKIIQGAVTEIDSRLFDFERHTQNLVKKIDVALREI